MNLSSLNRRSIGVLALALLACTRVAAATVECAVGDRVQGEFGGGEVGTIAEIGDASPYVGAYRITFRWSPRGEWYHPGTWNVQPEGSSDRCQPPAAVKAPPRPADQGDDDPTEPAPASAVTPLPQGTKSTAQCPDGRRVVDRERRLGSVRGELNGLCLVALDGGGSRSYLAWMLAPEGGAAATGGGLAPGQYTCSAGAAGSFPVQIVDGGSYIDRAGARGRYAVAGDAIDFTSGSLAGQYARLLGSGKFGLSSAPTRSFAVVCNRR